MELDSFVSHPKFRKLKYNYMKLEKYRSVGLKNGVPKISPHRRGSVLSWNFAKVTIMN